MESSRQDLLNDMAEHRPCLKYYQHTHFSLIFQSRIMFSHINEKLSPRPFEWRVFDSAKNHKRQRRKRQSVTAKREKSQTPKFV